MTTDEINKLAEEAKQQAEFLPVVCGCGVDCSPVIDAINALRDAALAAQKDAGWISVEERLPLERDGAVVVLLNSEEPAIAWATYWHGASNAFNCWLFPISGYYDDSDITHWMKLPAPPVSQQSEVK